MDTWTDPLFYRNFARRHPVIERAAGAELWDVEGKRYLLGGGSVVTIGYGVPEVTVAMVAQAEKVPYTYWTHFISEPQIALAEHVVKLAPTGITKAYFTSGGSEAMEVAVKLAYAFHKARLEPDRHKIIASWQGYHGSTALGLSIGGYKASRVDVGPYLQHFPKVVPVYCYRCPFRLAYPACSIACAADLERVICQEGPETVAAYVAEPLVAAGGAAIVPPPEYFRQIRDICDRYGVLMIMDEVITGFGRTGRNFGIDHWSVTPDLIVAGKGLSSGYTPIGAVLIHERLVDTYRVAGKQGFYLGYSYAGNPLTAAITLAVQEYAAAHGLYERVRDEAVYLRDRLSTLSELPIVGDIRGLGFMMGVELVADMDTRAPFPRSRRIAERVFEHMFDAGVFIGTTHGVVDGIAGDCLMIHPPFIVSRPQIDEIVAALRGAIGAVLDDVGGHV